MLEQGLLNGSITLDDDNPKVDNLNRLIDHVSNVAVAINKEEREQLAVAIEKAVKDSHIAGLQLGQRMAGAAHAKTHRASH